MGGKIFISYNYADCSVKNLDFLKNSKVRYYVTVFENILDTTDRIYKVENDDNYLSNLDGETIMQ